MVRNDHDRPAFIQLFQESADIAVCLHIDPLEHLLIISGSQAIVPLLQVFGDHVALGIDVVEMRKDHLIIFFIHEVIEHIRLPIQMTIPAGAHAVPDQASICAAQHRSGWWYPKIVCYFLIQ